MREGSLTAAQRHELIRALRAGRGEHLDHGPVTEEQLHRMTALAGAVRARLYLRAPNAVYLTTAQEIGEPED